MSSHNSEDDFVEEYCDPETCYYCNPELQNKMKYAEKIEEKVKQSDGKDILATLLYSMDEFTVIGNIFSLQQYLKWGYNIGDKVEITFVKSSDRLGVLKNRKETHIWVYHSGSISYDDDDNQLPKICPYFFWKRGPNGVKGLDKDAINHVKILFKDDIFDESVHDGNGVIIENSELQKHIDKSKTAIGVATGVVTVHENANYAQ